MFHAAVVTIIHYLSIPFLLLASFFSHSAADFELPVDFIVCLVAIIVVQRAVRCGRYMHVVEGAAVLVAFSPFSLLSKIFLALGLLCFTTSVIFLSALRAQTSPVAE